MPDLNLRNLAFSITAQFIFAECSSLHYCPQDFCGKWPAALMLTVVYRRLAVYINAHYSFAVSGKLH
jgi:hypothetical protein